MKVDGLRCGTDAEERSMTAQGVMVQQARFFSELGKKLEAGVPFLRALRQLQDELAEPLRGAVVALGDAIEAGGTFSQALARSSVAFEPGVVALVEGGEKAGWLHKVLPVVAEYVRR
jgi:type II secretory pathway component PulF